MRKQFLRVFTLVLVTLLLFVSCSGSLTDSLLKIMDGTNTNVYIKAGMVKPNTAAASKVLDALKTSNTTVEITDNKVSLNVGGADVEIEVKDEALKTAIEKGILQPQTAEQKKQLTESINEALSSPTNKEQLEKELAKEVTDKATQDAIKGTYALGSSALTTAIKGMDTESDVYKVLDDLAKGYADVATSSSNTTLTEADKAQAQLMTNVAASASAASEVLKSDKSAEEKMNDPAVKEFLNDTLTLYNAAKIATGSVDILTTEGLFDALMSSGNSKSLDVSGIPSNLKKLIPNLVEKLLGKDPSKYDSKIRSYTAMVNAKKAAFAIVGKDQKAPALKSQASIGSIIDYITAAAVKQIGNKGVSYEGIDLLEIVVDVVKTSGDGFFNDMKNVKTSYEEKISNLFKDGKSEAEMKKLMKALLDSLESDALIADKMLTVGESSLDDLLKQFKLDNEGKVTTISGFITKLKNDMEVKNE